MNSKRFFIHLFAIVTLGFGATANATVYHLICRGSISGNTNLTVEAFPDADNTMGTWIHYQFQRYTGSKASVKSDGSHLAAGQCSWATNVLSSSHTYFNHTIHNSKIYLHASFAPTIGSEGLQQPASPNIWTAPDRSDPSQDYLPYFGSNAIVPQGEGSIVDPNYIFHFYVSINSDNVLEFYRLNSIVKLY